MSWSVSHRVAFRFICSYFVLYFFPLPHGLTDPEWLSGLTVPIWRRVVPWVGEQALHLHITPSQNSTDTTYTWVQILCIMTIAVAATAVWSVVDSRRREYRELHSWLRIWLRYVLAAAMLQYGMYKVIHVQFPTPSYARLSTTYGDSSPMGLMWRFMGYSPGYVFFAGAGECLGALLLFFRRTTTVGALVVVFVMSNVVMLNFSYDVPVKLGSSHLLLLAVFLVAPDAKRLADAFLLNRATEPADLRPHFNEPWMRVASACLKSAVILGYIAMEVHNTTELRHLYPAGDPPPPEGWYEVSTFELDGQDIPALASGGERWSAMSFARGDVTLIWPDNATKVYRVSGDRPDGRIALLPIGGDSLPIEDAPPSGEVRLAFDPAGAASAEGTLEGHAIKVTMARKSASDVPLMKRGFHWVTETPFNR